ncbi:transmembrane 9 superfamily member 4-like [Morus notabilis]|uniref:transmembrane 9 superfamily member 4-like n=1 Tax=Morus notabilis TaxID=981085 RepID=UPI000CED09F7|nr:transmembrane 9 superfamily member 4-like [Morus notabilis]
MAVDLRIGLVALVLMTPLLLSGRFLSNESTKPTKDDLRFEDGDRIPLFANKGMMGRVDDTDESRPRYYLVTHLRFYPLYTRNQVKRIIVTEDFDSAVDITEDVEIKVKFTYSVLWVEVRMRHDTYEFLPAQSWNSILSLMFWPSAVFFLFGLLLLLLLAPYFTANFTRYCHQSIESARAVNHSRPIHDNNCNCPPYFSLLGAFLGPGIQLLITAFILFILAYNQRMLSLDTILLKECIFLAGNLYFILVCLTVFSVNIVAQINFGESEIAEFGESFNVLMACGIFTGALSTLGGMIAYCSKEKTSEVPCPTRTTTTQRDSSATLVQEHTSSDVPWKSSTVHLYLTIDGQHLCELNEFNDLQCIP